MRKDILFFDEFIKYSVAYKTKKILGGGKLIRKIVK